MRLCTCIVVVELVGLCMFGSVISRHVQRIAVITDVWYCVGRVRYMQTSDLTVWCVGWVVFWIGRKWAG